MRTMIMIGLWIISECIYSQDMNCYSRVSQNYQEGSIPSIGEIISSILDFKSFSKLYGNTGEFDPFTFKWSPADGRNVTGSTFACLDANSDNVPDLRGVFLRGANSFASDEEDIVSDRQKNPQNMSVNQFQSDTVGYHSHKFEGGVAIGVDTPPGQPGANLQGGDPNKWSKQYHSPRVKAFQQKLDQRM